MHHLRRYGLTVVAAATLSLSVTAIGTSPAVGVRVPMPASRTYATFNDPTKTDPSSPYNRSAISNELRSLIARAAYGSKIQIATYMFKDPRTASALKDAFENRAVDVQVVVDPNQVADDPETGWRNVYWDSLARALNSRDDGSWAKTCPLKPGGGCFVSEADNKMHNKFAIFSNIGGKTVVFQSSNNLVPTGSSGGGDGQWNNAVTVVGKPVLHAQYQDYFNRLGANAPGSHGGTVPAPDTDDSDGFMPRFFPDESPSDDPIISILREVDCDTGAAGTTKVRIAMAFWDRQGVWYELRAMDARGCDVQVIYNPAHVSTPTDRSGLGGIKSWPLERLHSKYLAIDGYYEATPGVRNQVVWTGSHNYTHNAWKSNDEVLLGIDSPTIHRAYVRNFDTLKSRS